jgi:two-component system nitrate/nitrite response regulator NarL
MRILVVDDDQLLARPFAKYLESNGDKYGCTDVKVDAVFSLRDAVAEIASSSRPDFVLLDLNLKGDTKGAATLEAFQRENHSKVPVAVFTGISIDLDDNVRIIRRCYRELGACGVILKSGDTDRMFVGLERMLAGEEWLPDVLIRALTAELPANEKVRDFGLNPTEMNVARLLARGYPNRKIAIELKLKDSYVRQVVSSILEKLGVRNRTQAAIILEKS